MLMRETKPKYCTVSERQVPDGSAQTTRQPILFSHSSASIKHLSQSKFATIGCQPGVGAPRPVLYKARLRTPTHQTHAGKVAHLTFE
jgi:hypothetical protein